MADISLREYLAKLDTLLKSGSAAEVILHCRHILQYFPKNAQAYRLLGQALVATSRWQEAGEVMRRVLSVFPDDRDAHAGLSELYRIEKRPDDSIWHLERAFEQTPNDETILENLRELYRKFRKVEHGKVQLTAAAVARQYIRNGLFDQAIDTLQKARTASPERVDLPLLLAQTYWDRGQRVEAAETALEVLRVLPNCLVANTLLAAMWLTESRPSDAQRYIGRIESLDPYLALELAQGQEVPDEAFKLEELDYQRAAERELVSQTPDWLVDVTGDGETQDSADEVDINAVPDFFNDITPDDIVAKQEFRGPLTSADWGDGTDDLPSFTDDSSPTIPKATGPLSGLAGRFNKPPTGSLSNPTPPPKTSVPGAKRGLTGMLTPLPEQTPQPEPVTSDSLPSFMQNLGLTADQMNASPDLDQTGTIYTSDLPDLSSLVPDAAQPEEDLPFRRERSVQPENNDPLAWLRSTGVEINEDVVPEEDNDQFDTEADTLALQEADAADPLSWLQGYGGNDLVVEQEQPEFPMAIEEDEDLPLPPDQDGDPLAWLNSAQTTSSAAPRTQTPQPESLDDDPLDWLSDDTLLDEAFDLESLVNNQSPLPEQTPMRADVSSTAATPEWQDTMADEKDPLDWLSSEPEPDAEPSDSFTWMDESQSAVAPPSQVDFPDWLGAAPVSSEVVDGADFTSDNDWMTDLPDLETSAPVEEAPSSGSSMLNWLGKEKLPASDASPTEQPASSAPSWFGDLQADSSSTASSTVDENGFEWMSTADELPPVANANDIPDWLTSMDIGSTAEVEPEPLAAADAPAWLSSTSADEPEIELPAAKNIPDWMSQSEPAPATANADMPDWLSSMEPDEPEAEPLAAADAPDWLSSMEPDEPEAEPLAAADAPDWLSSMEPDEPEAEPLAAADAPDWLTSLEPDVPATELEPLATDDTPDWLTKFEPDDEPVAEAEPLAAADAPDWLTSLEPDDEPVAEAEPLAATDTPDWLSAMQPDGSEFKLDAEPEPIAAADTPDWLTSMEPDDEPIAEAEPIAATDTPDWLSAMQPDEPESEPIAAADTTDWLTSLEPDDEPVAEAEPIAAADTPDWLSAMQPDVDEFKLDTEAKPIAAADAPDWLTSLEPDDEPIAEADTPDWLSAMQPNVDEFKLDDEPEPIAASEAPDWLTSLEPDDEPVAEAEPIATTDAPDWLTNLEPERIAATDAPDWLSAMQPDDDEFQLDDEPVAEAEPIAEADTPDWLAAMQPDVDEFKLDDEPEPIAAADTPDWLSAMQPDDDEFKLDDEPEPIAANDTPDWLSAMQSADEVEAQAVPEPHEFAIQDDMPDWLSTMQPADDEPVAEEPMSDDEWTEAGEMAPEMKADVPDWLSAINDSKAAATTDDADNFEWDTNSSQEARPAAPAPASNAPDWLNAMVPGLDVDYDAPEDAPVETEFMPTNKAAPAPRAPKDKDAKVRPEFGWLLDIVSEESQQVTVVADKTALRRFVFSHLPTWLRKPTEQSDNSSDDNEADNVDIPPWLQ